MERELLKKFERELLKPIEGVPKRFGEVLDYSLEGGKRIRPLLVLASYQCCGGENPERVIPASCAIEYMHTASLLLDDLPCMDNSSLRRNKPAVHSKYGEVRAILAGMYFVNSAYKLLSQQETGSKLAELLSSADRALYQAKHLGRNHAVVDAKPLLPSGTPAAVAVR